MEETGYESDLASEDSVVSQSDYSNPHRKLHGYEIYSNYAKQFKSDLEINNMTQEELNPEHMLLCDVMMHESKNMTKAKLLVESTNQDKETKIFTLNEYKRQRNM